MSLMTTSARLAIPLLLAATACTTQSPPPAAPEPAPVASPEPAPEPAAEPQPAPAPDRRGEVVALLDQIEHQWKECEEKKMHDVTHHSESIHDLVAKLEGPIADFPDAQAHFAELKTQAEKFVEACKKGNHKDQHHHHHELGDVLKKMRAALGA